MHIADQPPPLHIAHDVFHGRERGLCARLVVHGQENASQELIGQHQHRQGTKEVPQVKVLGGIVLTDVLLVK